MSAFSNFFRGASTYGCTFEEFKGHICGHKGHICEEHLNVGLALGYRLGLVKLKSLFAIPDISSLFGRCSVLHGQVRTRA